MTNLPAPFSRYDADPEALAWARAKIQAEIDRARRFALSAEVVDDERQADTWRRLANRMQRVLIGGEGCVHAAFDERLPDLVKAIDTSLPAPIDRAIRRDHSLCGVDPCTDCR